MQKVLLLGATGYVGSHVLDNLVSQRYQVIAAVEKPSQAEFYRRKYPHNNLAFVTIPDICQENTLNSIMKYNQDIDYVIHLASPPLTGDSDKDIDRAAKAMTNVIKSIDKHGDAVETLAVGSSFAAMINDPPRFRDPNKTYTSRDVNQITRDQAKSDSWKTYLGIKTFAETACWKTYSNMFPPPQFALTSIALPLVLGPPIHDFKFVANDNPNNNNSSNSSSNNNNNININNSNNNNIKKNVLKHHHHHQYYKISSSSNTDDDYFTDLTLNFAFNLIDSRDTSVDDLPIPFAIDVRDAAMAFVRAIQLPPQTNRWFMASHNVCSQQIVDIARQSNSELHSRLPTGNPGSAEDELDVQCSFDISDTNESVGIQYIPLESTIKDTFETLLRYK